VYQTILEELGQRVVTARSGADALRQVLLYDFAVILLDVNMPGMDGFETAALIRKRKKSAHTPIIFVTAFTDEVRTAQGYAHGAVDYIPAPVVPEILRAKVRVFVDLFRMTQQVQRQAEERVAFAEEKSKRAAAEESNRRLSFLARAGTVLGQSLEHDVTARDLARLMVPFLADVAVVALQERPGSDGKAILARLERNDVVLEDFARPEDLPPPLSAALAAAVSRNGTNKQETLGVEAGPLVLPLQARGRTFGRLILSRAASARRFEPDDRAMAEDLAARAAIALENARLYHDVRQADRQKNEFLSMLAHELRNPLAPICNAVHVLRLRGLDQPELRWARDVIDRQVKHMTRLVDDLLDLSRITRGKIRLKLEPIEISAIVAQAVEASRPVIEARRHHIELKVPSEPLWVNGDSARLAQVLTNLLNNAAKYTEEGGKIWLSIQRDEGMVVLRVRDNGIGIPRDMIAAVFDLFTQVDRALDRSEGGLGIGLTLVRRLVEMHGGTVAAQSDGLGHGSEFIVRLPEHALQSAPALPASAPTSISAPPPQRRVLLVDDNVDSADSLGMLLRLNGYEVHVVHDGPAALEAARNLTPDFVVLDIGLPGMDGFEVARRLRVMPQTQEVLLIAVTGYGQTEDRARSFQAGFDHHLVKPVEFSTLHELLLSRSAPTATVAGAPA
jgi:signal transduction histidine kinase/DNA-binding response OmpR family regulator